MVSSDFVIEGTVRAGVTVLDTIICSWPNYKMRSSPCYLLFYLVFFIFLLPSYSHSIQTYYRLALFSKLKQNYLLFLHKTFFLLDFLDA